MGPSNAKNWHAASALFFGAPWKIFLWGAVFITIYLLLESYAHPASGDLIALFAEFLRDLGIAFIVVFGVSMAVEIRAADERNSFLQEATSHILETYFRMNLPTGWFEYIRSLIENNSFIRDQTVVSLNLKRLSGLEGFDDVRGFLILEQEISFTVENVSKRTGDLNYEIAVYIEKPLDNRFLPLVQMNEMRVNDVKLDFAQLAEADRKWEDGVYLKKFSRTVTLPKGVPFRIYTRCTTVKYERDHFVWAALHPSQGIEVVCRPPSGIKAFISLLHPDSLGLDPVEVPPEGREIIRVDSPVIPGTCAEFSWHPVSIQPEMPILSAVIK